jgi:hypothetical protein
LLRWKARLFAAAENLLRKDVDLRILEGEALFDDLLKALVTLVERLPGYEHPPHLSGGQVSAELEDVARTVLEEERDRRESADDQATSEEWPDPESIDTDKLPVPAFDLRFLPPALRPWIADIVDRAQCPPDFLGVGAAGSAGALIAQRVGIRPKRYDDWRVIPNLWGGIIAPPGFLKSPMIAEILKPVRGLAYDEAKRFEQAKKDYETEAVVLKAKRENIEQLIKAAVKAGKKKKSKSSVSNLGAMP